MELKTATQTFQRVERDLGSLIKGSLQKNAPEILGTDEATLAGYTARLAKIREDMFELHNEIGANTANARGPGRKFDE